MKALAGLQREFQRYIYARDPRFLARVAEKSNRRERAEIYWRAYRARLVEALDENYPGLRSLAGERMFARLANAFVESHSSRHANLRWYGGELPPFLRGHGAGRQRPWLAEVAAFDWALGLAFDAADEIVVTAEELAAVAPERWSALRFAMHPSLRRLDLRYNVGAIRKATDAGEPPPRPVARRCKTAWIVWRQGLATYFRSLDRPRRARSMRCGQARPLARCAVCSRTSCRLPKRPARRRFLSGPGCRMA